MGLDVAAMSGEDVPVDEPRSANPPVGGYALVLLGVLGFVVGCFLPYYGRSAVILPRDETASLYNVIFRVSGGALENVGAALYLFAGAAAVALLALAGILRPKPWSSRALLGAISVWTLTWIGVLINQTDFGPFDVGYWTMLASLGVAIAGGIVVWISTRARGRRPGPPAA